MTTLASSLLDFILDLLRDPAAAAQFEADPDGALADAGLEDVCVADVDALTPVLADSLPVAAVTTIAATADPSAGLPAHDDGGHQFGGHGGPPPVPPVHEGGHEEGHGTSVVEYIKYIQNNYSHTDIDASHSVWAGGDAYQLFGNDNVVTTGGSIVAGDGTTVSTDDSVEIRDSNNGSGNTVDGDGNVVGPGINLGNTDNSDHSDNSSTISDNSTTTTTTTSTDVEVEDVTVGDGNTTVEDSQGVGNVVDSGNDSSDNSTDVEIKDSFQDNSVVDSLNDNSTDTSTDVAVDVADSFQDNSYDSADVDVEHSFQDNSVVDSGNDSSTEVEVEDSFQDNSLDETVVVAEDLPVEDTAVV